MRRMPRAQLRPEPVELVLVDGTNVAHSLGREGGGGPTPVAGILATLRAAFAPSIPIEVVFDGPPSGPSGRITAGVVVRFSGRRSADDIIAERTEAEVRANGPVAAAAILVLTDDGGLAARIHRLGARARRADFLGAWADRLGSTRGRPSRSGPPPVRPSGPAGSGFGHRRPPRIPDRGC